MCSTECILYMYICSYFTATSFDAIGRPVAAAFYTGQVGYHDLIYVSTTEVLLIKSITKISVNKQLSLINVLISYWWLMFRIEWNTSPCEK